MRNSAKIHCKCCGLAACLVIFTACSQYEMLLKKARSITSDEETYTPAPGNEATRYFSRTVQDLDTNMVAVNEALGVTLNEKAKLNLYRQGFLSLTELDETPEVSEEASQVLKKVRQAKKELNSEAYLEDDPSLLMPEAVGALKDMDRSFLRSDQVTMRAGYLNFTISNLDKMPVRDQGSRGTCASFAAIGQIEGLILKSYTGINSIDLSEQRFYYMSKPANWATGGDVAKGGSDPGTGFAKSYPSIIGTEPEGQWTNGSLNKKPEDTPTGSDAYNIPLESECPYVAELKSNDLQTPQATGCKGMGVARVDSFVAWMYNQSTRPITAQQLYDQLVTTDAPVVVMTKLSSNWEANDGMITKADADAVGDGASSHSAGHAYLIVGARQLNETEFPGEGGLCFVIKNSWGKGWGINGYSCMTLAWFNEWRFDSGFPQAYSVSLDTTKVSAAIAKEKIKPTAAAEPDDQTKVLPERRVKQRGTLTFLTASEDPGYDLDDFELGAVLNDQDEYSKILYHIDGNIFYLRGLLDGGEKQTHETRFDYTDGVLSSTFDGKGSVNLGKWDAEKKILTLCAQEYAEVCDFHYLPDSNELLVGLTEEEFEREDSQAPFTWRSLNLIVKNLEVSFPQFLPTKLDARFSKDNKATNPLRFNIEPFSGAIIFQKQKVGNYFSGAFCTGDYAKVCRLVKTSEQFLVLFKSDKN